MGVGQEPEEEVIILETRPKPAYGRQGLDWIVRPGHSFGAKNVTSLTGGSN